jgi:hypothetical protein
MMKFLSYNENQTMIVLILRLEPNFFIVSLQIPKSSSMFAYFMERTGYDPPSVGIISGRRDV